MRKFIIVILSYLFGMLCTAEVLRYEIKIKDHKFIPSVIEAPANSIIKLIITNLDPSVEEFESFDLKREKIIGGNGEQITVTFGPLKPGEYKFFGEFNPETAQGKLIIKETKNA